jgi:putative spermidine/putrescine transport system ATP-binding protein
VRYGSSLAVDNVTLEVEPGSCLALLGPSGCGKTTLLRLIAGFVRAASGRVTLDGRGIDHLPPGQRGTGIVFQNYALFPHMSVADNVAYGLEARGWKADRIKAKVEESLDAVQMTRFAERRPRQLSGGQQQRVALARAIATEPALLLLDEPFAALDRALRLDMQLEIRRLQRKLGLTAVMVTHDQDEAMSMADRMAVMRGGRIEQVGEPAHVYDAPGTLFVAGFVGIGVRLAGRVVGRGAEGYDVHLDAGAVVPVASRGGMDLESRVIVSVRPEHFTLHDDPATDRIPAILRQSAPLGPSLVHDVRAGSTEMKIIEARTSAIRPPGPVHVGLVRGARPALFPSQGEPTA